MPDRIERRGNFRIEYYQSDALGHTSTRREISHVNGSKTPAVTRAAVSFQIAPFDRDRIVYYTCDGDSGCTHLYFDGHTGKNHVIGRGLKISMSALEDGSRWSVDGRYLALGDQHELVLVDLQSGTSTRLTETLRLDQPLYPDKWEYREVWWGAWSPDSAHASLFVLSPHGPGLPVREVDQELYAFDTATSALTLVARHTGRTGVRGEGGLWSGMDLRWDGATLQPPR